MMGVDVKEVPHNPIKCQENLNKRKEKKMKKKKQEK